MNHQKEMEDLRRQLADARRDRILLMLQGRLQKYQRRLMKEGLAVAEQRGIKVKVVGPDYKIGDDNIAARVEEYSDGRINPSELIELAKPKMPSLFRKYHTDEKKYFELLDAREKGH